MFHKIGLGIALLMAAGPALAEQMRPQLRPDYIVRANTVVAPAKVIAVAEPVSPPARQIDPATVSAEVIVGPETNLPLPRFVSLKTSEGNVRRGPSLSHRIDWVFLRRGMPLQVTAEYGHWRRVADREGLGGWVHYSLLSGNRTVLIEADLAVIYPRPDPATTEVAILERGVVADLGECEIDWCRISSGGYRGWALKSALWGVGADEIRD